MGTATGAFGGIALPDGDLFHVLSLDLSAELSP
jgi:hypothetical protein